MYYPSSENKGADQLRGNCVFVFAYADCWFPHEVAHLTLRLEVVLMKLKHFSSELETAVKALMTL